MSPDRIHRELQIRASAEAVFAVIADPAQTPRWLVGVRSMTVVTPGAIRVGSETVSKVEALGRVWDARGRCVAFDPPRRITIESTLGPGMRSRSDSEVISCAEGAILKAEMAFQLPGGPLGALVSAAGARSMIERDFDSSLNALKQLIETEWLNEGHPWPTER